MGIVRGANLDIADVPTQVIKPVWNRFARRQRGPVMVVNLYRCLGIDLPGPIKRAYQLLFLVSMLMTGAPAAW